VAMDVEGERADGDQQREEQRDVDRDRRLEREDREDRGCGGERGGEEVVGRFVQPYREHDERERAEEGDRRHAREGRETQLEAEHLRGRVDRHGREVPDGHRQRRERDRAGKLEPLAEREDAERRDTEERDRRDQGSRTARSLTMRNAPASATTTCSHARSSVYASCGPGTRATSSCVPVSMSSAPSDPRTAPRAVSRIAIPDDSSQNAAASWVTPLGSSPMRLMCTSSFEVVRR